MGKSSGQKSLWLSLSCIRSYKMSIAKQNYHKQQHFCYAKRLLEPNCCLVSWGFACNSALNLFLSKRILNLKRKNLSAWVISTSQLAENEILKDLGASFMWKTVAPDEENLNTSILRTNLDPHLGL